MITALFRSSVLLLVFNYFLEFASAHVSLTFPPARKYNLDYLDSFGSPPPCGMPKGSTKTSLIAGSTILVTWHLGYPHRGSHRLELLSPNGTEIYLLAAETDTNDTTAQKHQVTLPHDFECRDCIIRLKRQSAELNNPDYWFWSCGDVDIVKPEDYVETCFGNGRARANGKCGCKAGFWGKRCQYEDECRKNSDCGKDRGKCIDLGGTTLPRRQCFCEYGFIGKKCSKESKPGNVPLPNPDTLTDEFVVKNYLHQVLDKEQRVHLYWRLIEGKTLQIEFVLLVNGTSYVALGWRPLNFEGDCMRYPPESRQNHNSISERRRRQSSNLTIDEEVVEKIRSRNEDKEVRPKPNVHPMSCADVVIGQARGRYSRVLDHWSGDISTPREDGIYGGTDDLEAGAGWENEYGVTTIVFRKKVLTREVGDRFNDWPLDVPSLVIWARGQEHGEYVHSLPSGVDPGQPASVPNYYVQDEVKYHGYKDQRGAFSIDFLAPGTREFFVVWAAKNKMDEQNKSTKEYQDN